MTVNGKWIDAAHGGKYSFNFSLMVNSVVLLPGIYIIQVDPTWDNTSILHEDYKTILIDIYCPEALNITEVS